MNKTLTVTMFKDSNLSFLSILDKNNIKYNRHLKLSTGPIASGIAIEIIITGGWGALAVACLAWAHVNKSRKINITTKDNTSIWLEGYSAEEAEKILESAKNVTVIQTDIDNENLENNISADK